LDEKPNVLPKKNRSIITKAITAPDAYQGQGWLRKSKMLCMFAFTWVYEDRMILGHK
jgi:hypothetical protein